jgi:hypothetical protein
LVVVISLALFKILEILDPLISEIGPSDFADLGLAEQIVALHIDQKLDYLVWQTGTSIFLENQNFFDLIKNLMLAAPNRSSPYFHPWKHDVQ